MHTETICVPNVGYGAVLFQFTTFCKNLGGTILKVKSFNILMSEQTMTKAENTTKKIKTYVLAIALLFLGFLLLKTVHTRVYPYLLQVSESAREHDHDDQDHEHSVYEQEEHEHENEGSEHYEYEHEDHEDHAEYAQYEHEDMDSQAQDHDHSESGDHEGHEGKGRSGKGYGRGRETTTQDYLKFAGLLAPLVTISAIAAINSVKDWTATASQPAGADTSSPTPSNKGG